MDIRDFREILKKEGFNIKISKASKSVKIADIYLPSDKLISSVMYIEDSEDLKRYWEIVKEHNVTEITVDGERIVCGMLHKEG